MKYIIVIIACTLSFKTNAQRGALDKTFGTEGIVISKTFNAGCEATAIQADGKIIAAGAGGYNGVGGFFLARYNTDGTLDSNFGDKGRVITDFIETGSSRIESVAALPNGKILAAGFFAPSSLVDIVLLQYNANGNLDSSFGENGIVITDIAKYDYIYDMAIQPDGKIIVAGDRRKSDNDNKTSFTVRYMPDGNLDESFGDNGIALTSYNASIDITTVALQTDGKIVLGGIYHSGEDEFMLVRYQSNGVLDSTFDGNGIATLRFKDGLSEYAELFDIAVQPDGKILATGDNNDGNKIVVARFKSNGEADEEFGTVDGYTSPFFENGTSYGSTVLIQQDGKILIAGTHYNQVEGFYTLIRLKNDGTRDSTFGDNGITLTSFNNIGYITCGAAAIQPDGKVVLVGTLEQDIAPYYYFLLTRYNNDGGIVPPPEFAKIQKWQGHYGFTWNSWPGNKTTYYSVGRSTNASSFTEIAQVTD
ncbi:MAG TPA: delta-60 repeat domain-containing protein, partial [Panacibacter sp.]|nr:delta-60 repeat domain-containing protein [Panacibacter sp.]